MMNSRNLILTCVCTFLCGCSVENILSEKEYNQGINVLPLPQNINVGSGRFIISKSTQITISDDSLGQVADFYARKMQASTGMNVKVTDKKVENASICLLTGMSGKVLTRNWLPNPISSL